MSLSCKWNVVDLMVDGILNVSKMNACVCVCVVEQFVGCGVWCGVLDVFVVVV